MLIFFPKYVQIRQYYLNLSLVNVQCAINWFQHMRDLCKNAVQKCLFELHVVLLFLFTVEWRNCDLWCRMHATKLLWSFEWYSKPKEFLKLWSKPSLVITATRKTFWQQFSVVCFFPFGIKELFHKRNLHCVFLTPYVNYFQHISALQKALKLKCSCSLSLQCLIKWHLFYLVCYCFMWWQWVVSNFPLCNINSLLTLTQKKHHN